MILLFVSSGEFSGTPSAARTITVKANGSRTPTLPFVKDPDATFDFSVDWDLWLDGDSISSSTFSVPSGLTAPFDSNSTTRATIWLSGGTARTSYSVTNRIVTAGGRTNDQTIRIKVLER